MSQNKTAPRLVWLYSDSLGGKLDAATWLETSRELGELGWHVTLIAAGASATRVMQESNILCIPKPRIYLVRQFVFHLHVLRVLLREWDSTDVLLFHAMSAPWVLPLRALRRVKRHGPLFVMDTRTLPMTRRDKVRWRERLRRIYSEQIERGANAWSDGRVAITPRMAEALHIPSAKLLGVWHSGVNIEQFAGARTIRQWSRGMEPIRLIYIGALDHARNLMPLTQAVECANRQGMCFVLSLVGEGAQRSELEQFARGTEGRVECIPPIPHAQVWEQLARAHVGVLPFPDEEKFRVSSPIKLFEYMAAGLPILATRIACHTDVIANGRYVFWSEGADEPSLVAALGNVWQSRNCLSEMGDAAAAAAVEWTWRKSAKKLGGALELGLDRRASSERNR